MLGVTRQFLYLLMKRGELASVTIGRCRRIPITEVHRIAGVPLVAPPADADDAA
jgi:excisionase family DNA binding protein